MNSLLPEPGALRPSPPTTHGPRPAALNVLMGLELAGTVIQGLIYQPAATSVAMGTAKIDMISTGIFAMLWLALLYFVWSGRNWARICMIVGSVLGALSVFMIASQNLPNQVLTVFNTILACVWIYFLRTRPMVEFAKGVSPDLQ